LLNARRSHLPVKREDVKALLVAVPKPSGNEWTELPSTVDEVAEISSILPPSMLLPLHAAQDPPSGGNRSPHSTALLKKLPQATILHLACHGVQDARNPLESGFVLGDGVLTIDKLMPLPLPHAFLAFLSACETAKGDSKQPDQAVHLAATMLFAGFKSVIATLWCGMFPFSHLFIEVYIWLIAGRRSMEDIDGPLIARYVYRELFESGHGFLNPDDIPYALDMAVQRLKEAHPEPSRWAPYIHLGI
jgi:hypothetical protein